MAALDKAHWTQSTLSSWHIYLSVKGNVCVCVEQTKQSAKDSETKDNKKEDKDDGNESEECLRQASIDERGQKKRRISETVGS